MATVTTALDQQCDNEHEQNDKCFVVKQKQQQQQEQQQQQQNHKRSLDGATKASGLASISSSSSSLVVELEKKLTTIPMESSSINISVLATKNPSSVKDKNNEVDGCNGSNGKKKRTNSCSISNRPSIITPPPIATFRFGSSKSRFTATKEVMYNDTSSNKLSNINSIVNISNDDKNTTPLKVVVPEEVEKNNLTATAMDDIVIRTDVSN